MPDALGVCGTMCKVKKEKNLFLEDSKLPSQIARPRVRLLYRRHLALVLSSLVSTSFSAFLLKNEDDIKGTDCTKPELTHSPQLQNSELTMSSK